MWQRYLADAVVVTHFAWIGFVILGQLLIVLGMLLRWQWIRNFPFRFVHLMMILLVALETMFAVPCPMTVWERRLRGFQPGDRFEYTEADSFIARWVGEIIFIDAESGPGAMPFFLAYLAFAGLVVWSFLAAPPRLPMSPAGFMALVHALVGVIFLGTLHWYPGIGLFFLMEAYVWYRLGMRRPPQAPAGGDLP